MRLTRKRVKRKISLKIKHPTGATTQHVERNMIIKQVRQKKTQSGSGRRHQLNRRWHGGKEDTQKKGGKRCRCWIYEPEMMGEGMTQRNRKADDGG